MRSGISGALLLASDSPDIPDSPNTTDSLRSSDSV